MIKPKEIIVSLLIVMIGQFAIAQFHFAMPVEITRAPGSIRATAGGDLDGDGLAEVVYAAGDGRIVMIYQDSNNQFKSHKTLPVDVYLPTHLFVLDCDQDGDLDIFVSSSGLSGASGKLLMFHNNGAGVFGDPVTLLLNATSISDMHILDLDQDGLNDVVMSSYFDDVVNWSKNNGAGEYQEFQTILSGYSLTNISYGDDDNDGDIDIISGELPGTGDYNVVRFEQISELTFSEPEIVYSWDEQVSATVLVDIDNDGDLDVLASWSSNDAIHLYLNDGGGVYGLNGSLSNAGFTSELIALDWNEDGLTDIISVQGSDDQIVVHTNNGTTLTNGSSLISEDQPGTVTIQDIDQDDDLDLIFSSYLDGDYNLHVAKNNGNNFFGSTTILTFKAQNCFGMFCKDFDGDSINDLIYSDNDDDNVIFVKGNGDGTFGLPSIIANYSDVGLWGLNMADFDQDGDDDFVLERYYSQDNQRLTIHKRNNTGLSFTATSYIEDNYLHDIEVGDFNGDQLPDLLVLSDFNAVSWIENENNGAFNTLQGLVNLGFNSKICVLNANNDIYMDFACQNSAEGVVVRTFTELGTTSAYTVVPSNNGVLDLLGADINMDGFEDLVVSADVDAWYENDGAGGFGTVHNIPNGNFFLQHMITADLNNDNYPELIATSGISNSSLLIFPNDGTGEYGSPIILYSGDIAMDRVIAGDVDQDGKPDLITTFDNVGNLVWFRNLGELCEGWTAEVSNPESACSGETISMVASGGISYNWENANFGSQVDVNIVSDTTFHVTIVNADGCQQTLTVDIEMLVTPNIVVSQQGSQLVATGGIAYQWYFNGEAIEGSTGPTIAPLQNGEYYATGISNLSCEGVSNTFSFNGINVIENTQEVWTLFPNPGTDRFILKGSLPIQSVRITDMTGRLILDQNMTTSNGEVVIQTPLSCGHYIIEVVAQSGVKANLRWIVE